MLSRAATRVVLLLLPLLMAGQTGKPLITFYDIEDPEAYAFWDSLFKSEHLFGPKEKVVIGEVPLGFALSLYCNHPPSEEERKMVEAARANGKRLSSWKRYFHMDRAYTFMAGSEVYQAKSCILSLQDHHPLTGCEAYVNVRGVRFLSIPVFNADHTRALVTWETVFGNL